MKEIPKIPADEPKLFRPDRQPMFENEITKKYGLMATCNACDRIIFEDENWREQYIENGGYCKDCKIAD